MLDGSQLSQLSVVKDLVEVVLVQLNVSLDQITTKMSEEKRGGVLMISNCRFKPRPFGILQVKGYK